jgi:glycosyltransferase involved in cell wall biosynthesis
MASLKAFEKAFSYKNDNVALFIKAMNVSVENEMWRFVIEAASRDTRIHIFQEYMNPQGLLNFMASCDALISLHRSEGFGRIIAEAMLLEIAVIATNFSGNVDFCTQETSYLVDGALIPLAKGDYLFYEDQYWMDPDIELASLQIQLAYEDSRQRVIKLTNAKNLITEKYSIAAVGAAYKDRLSEVANPSKIL